jgi:uncharacterized protein with PQ loop repeat
MAHYHFFDGLRRKKQITFIDRLMTVAAVVHPLMGTPQVYQIYSTQDVGGISLFTWFGFMLLGLVFLLYGIVHRIRPLIVTQILWFIVDFLVVLGVLLYR